MPQIALDTLNSDGLLWASGQMVVCHLKKMVFCREAFRMLYNRLPQYNSFHVALGWNGDGDICVKQNSWVCTHLFESGGQSLLNTVGLTPSGQMDFFGRATAQQFICQWKGCFQWHLRYCCPVDPLEW